ncbi:MAG: terminase [Desulfobacteraceae bacterium]|nr:terminase [Desulfobacteraceae bacterium]
MSKRVDASGLGRAKKGKVYRTGKEKSHHLEGKSWAELKEKFSDKWWRLNNLYYIVDEDGQRVLFKPNIAQTCLYDNIWYQNLILKARQMGFTTFIDIYFLDEILFNSDVEAAIIAHNKEDAGKIFRRKILYPYNNLPDWLKEARPTISKSKSELELSNSSIISVGVSMRSGTAQLLHISEFGKICAKFPEKAREIVTGALEAIHTEKGNSLLFIESTAEGKSGYFYEYSQEAQNHAALGHELTALDFRFHFFPWFQDPRNVIAQSVPISKTMADYFEETEAKLGITFSNQQKWWYVKKFNRLGEDMKREHPASPEEAFEQAIKGAYFKNQFVKIRRDRRICRVPFMSGAQVDTWWDLGMNDVMAIWFTQTVGREVHLVDYYENCGEQFEFYAKVLADLQQEHGFVYGTHNAPHDIGVRELGGTGADRWESALRVGIRFNRIPRVKHKIDSINAARRFLSICWFDENRCDQGMTRLENYRKQWNEHANTYTDKPLHDDNSNGADAFQTLAMGHNFHVSMGATVQVLKQNSAGWT